MILWWIHATLKKAAFSDRVSPRLLYEYRLLVIQQFQWPLLLFYTIFTFVLFCWSPCSGSRTPPRPLEMPTTISFQQVLLLHTFAYKWERKYKHFSRGGNNKKTVQQGQLTAWNFHILGKKKEIWYASHHRGLDAFDIHWPTAGVGDLRHLISSAQRLKKYEREKSNYPTTSFKKKMS